MERAVTQMAGFVSAQSARMSPILAKCIRTLLGRYSGSGGTARDHRCFGDVVNSIRAYRPGEAVAAHTLVEYVWGITSKEGEGVIAEGNISVFYRSTRELDDRLSRYGGDEIFNLAFVGEGRQLK
jgi:hypothetical protein